MRTKKRILLLVVLIVVAAAAGYYYVFYGGARDVATEESVYTVTTAELTQEFTADAQKANAKYSNKTINICGMATASAPTEIKIDEVVSCSFTSAAPQIPANQKTTIKGRFVGYDELFGEFKLDQCTLTIPNN